MSLLRNKFTAAFKAKVACEALRENKTINEISSANNVHQSQIVKWKKDLIKNSAMLFEKKSEKHSHKNIDLHELHRLIGEQATQIDWLKKKFGISN